MNIYLFKAVHVSASGEREFFVTPCSTEDNAMGMMKKEIKQRLKNSNAIITYGEIGDLVVELSDKEKNEYFFEIEATKVI